jgi:hypothetical protein
VAFGDRRELVEEVALRVLSLLDRKVDLHELPPCRDASAGSEAVVGGAGAGTPPDDAIRVTRTTALPQTGL